MNWVGERVFISWWAKDILCLRWCGTILQKEKTDEWRYAASNDMRKWHDVRISSWCEKSRNKRGNSGCISNNQESEDLGKSIIRALFDSMVVMQAVGSWSFYRMTRGEYANPDTKNKILKVNSAPISSYELSANFNKPSRLMLFGRSIGRPSARSQINWASGPRPRLTPKVAV